MDESLTLEFKALRSYIESSDMPQDEQVRAKVMLSNLRCNAEAKIGQTDREIERVSNEKVEAMRKEFKKAYTELANNYMSLEKHRDQLVQQLAELNGKCGQLERQVREKDSIINGGLIAESDKVVLSHIEKVKEGNISFKDEVDMSLIVDLYKQGYGAGKIAKELKDKEVTIVRQTVVNRLTRIGLWGNRETWTVEGMTDEQREYATRHGISL